MSLRKVGYLLSYVNHIMTLWSLFFEVFNCKINLVCFQNVLVINCSVVQNET